MSQYLNESRVIQCNLQTSEFFQMIFIFHMREKHWNNFRRMYKLKYIMFLHEYIL